MWMIQINEEGNIEWEKTYGGDYSEEARDVIQTNDGGYILAGWTFSYGDPKGNAWLIKTDDEGNMIWNKTYGGQNYALAFSVIQTNDEGYAFSGTKHEDVYDFWLVKVNEDGEIIWEKTYGQSGNDIAYSMIMINEGYVLTGRTYAKGSDSFWLVKVNEDGEIIWEKTYDKNDDIAYSIILTGDNKYLITGFTMNYGSGESNFWLVKVNEDGEIIWEKTYDYGRNEAANQIITNKDSEYVIVGQTDYESYPYSDILLVKIKEI